MRQALEGIKVAEFTWAGVGPLSSRYLADHGALVVKVESKTYPDLGRTAQPFKDRVVHPDRSAFFTNYNINKYGLTLDLGSPKGRELALRLATWADVLLEAFSPGTMKKWGLDYESLRQINPQLIMASTTQMGQFGPYKGFKGFGHQGSAMAGFGGVLGYSSEEPRLPYSGHPDFISHRYFILAIMSALLKRLETGEGQYIDHSQIESTLHFLSPAILDYGANGRVAQPRANEEFNAAPHNAYSCRGDDRWCVIAVYTDEEWQNFCRAIGKPSWSQDPRFATLQGRKENEEDLDRLVGSWTVKHPPEEVMQILQQSGVAAGIVARAQDLHEDPQLKHRNHYLVLDHPVIGPHTHDAMSFRLSQTPAQPRLSAPLLGQHNHYVCTDILGMSEEEFREFEREGSFG